MLRKSTPGISAPKWAVVSHRCRQKAESYTKHLTLRQAVQQSINSQVKQLQSQHLHLNTLSGVTLQPLALPRQKKPNYFKNVPLGVFLSPQAVTSFPCNLLLDIHSSETCLGAPREPGFLHHNSFSELLNNFLGAGPGLRVEYQPGQCPAQPPEPSGSPKRTPCTDLLCRD